MREFLVKRMILENLIEEQKERPNKEKVEHISQLLDTLDPVDDRIKEDARFDTDAFFQEHLRRREQYLAKKRRNTRQRLAKVAIFILGIFFSAQVVCYATTRKSIFYYFNQMKEQIQEIEIKFSSDDADEPERITEAMKEGELSESETVYADTWKEAVKMSGREYVYPRGELKGWKLKNIQVEMDGNLGDMIDGEYVKGDTNISYSMMYFTGEGENVVSFADKHKKIKEMKNDIGDFYFYQDSEGIAVIGYSGNIQISIDGNVDIEILEEIVDSIK